MKNSLILSLFLISCSMQAMKETLEEFTEGDGSKISSLKASDHGLLVSLLDQLREEIKQLTEVQEDRNRIALLALHVNPALLSEQKVDAVLKAMLVKYDLVPTGPTSFLNG